MARALGFRAEAKQVNLAIVEGTRKSPILVAHEKIAAPVGTDEASALSWYNNRVRLLVETHKPDTVGVRFPEPVARGSNKEGAKRRLRIEGVLLYTVDSCGLKVVTGTLATISSKLGTAKAKKYVDASEFRGIDLSKIPALEREAVLVAVAALPETAA